MKLYKYLTLACVLSLGMVSCDDYLNVNTDPDNPNNESISAANRLPWIQKFYQYSDGVTNMRTSCIAGVYYSNNGNNNALSVTWDCQPGSTTTSYQTWFVGAYSNIDDMYNAAMRDGCYHYAGVADVIKVMGFMTMVDLYGEVPYTEANPDNTSPAYDDGKFIYNACLDLLDEAIELFSRQQESGATTLASGDMWLGGDVDKWIKVCYGLKARYLLRVSKKSDLFNADEILNCLAKGPQSNSDNMYGKCYNTSSDDTDYLWGDPIMTNGNWDYVGYGSNQRISKYYKDLLVNMRGAGVVDPRMSKIVPATMGNLTVSQMGKVESYDWVRSEGVDIYGDCERLLAGATSITTPTYATADKAITYSIKDTEAFDKFVSDFQKIGYKEVASKDDLSGKTYAVDGTNIIVNYPVGSIYVNSSNYVYAGDTIYVNMRSNALMVNNFGQAATDTYWYPDQATFNAGAVLSTGSFQVRPVSDQDLLTYHEMCFIKAEVYMRKGQTAQALQAYQDGIRAHIDRMQTKLNEWKASGYDNPDMMPMDENDIANYMASAAVCQSAGELTMSDIMLQKYVAMGCSNENWVDMRRFNFSAGNVGSFGVVYPGYDRTKLFAGGSKLPGSDPTNVQYWIRRWRMPATLEIAYNENHVVEANANALQTWVWSIPVWWDCTSDSEYYGFIQ